jgi:hypothetical protein
MFLKAKIPIKSILERPGAEAFAYNPSYLGAEIEGARLA